MKTVLLSLVASLGLVFAISTAEAGGGTKPNSTIKVTNNTNATTGVTASATIGTTTGATVGVIVDPSISIQNAVNSGTISRTAFFQAGGQIVDIGNSAFFTVKSGSPGHNVTVIEITGGTTSNPTVGPVGTLTVTTTKGKTSTVIVTDNGGTPVLTLQ